LFSVGRWGSPRFQDRPLLFIAPVYCACLLRQFFQRTPEPMAEPQDIMVNEDARLIPMWSVVLAVVGFTLVEYYFWMVLPTQSHHMPPLGLRIYLNISWGLLAALYFLMVGYVSRDAPRRAMSPRFWMLLCFVMPGGIGAVLYFLLRQPLISRCEACGTFVQGSYHFCPQCNYQLQVSCGRCFSPVRGADQFCTRCGHALGDDEIPRRLRALG